MSGFKIHRTACNFRHYRKNCENTVFNMEARHAHFQLSCLFLAQHSGNPLTTLKIRLKYRLKLSNLLGSEFD